jgi:hypothetical protein
MYKEVIYLVNCENVYLCVLVSLTQLVGTMHKICKVGVQTPVTTKKNVYLCRQLYITREYVYLWNILEANTVVSRLINN